MSGNSLVPLRSRVRLDRVKFEGTDALINRPHGRFGGVRVVPVAIIRDALQILRSWNGPTNTH